MFYSVSIKIPSRDEEWEFKPINTLQQKELCKVMLLNNELLFINTINKIIIQCLDPKHNFVNLTLVDKFIILVKLRWESVGDSIDIEIEKGNNQFKDPDIRVQNTIKNKFELG